MQESTLPLVRNRPGKPSRQVDLRPYIESIDVVDQQVNTANSPAQQAGFDIRFLLKLDHGATAHPDELLDLMQVRDLLDEGLVMVRSRVILASQQENLPQSESSGEQANPANPA